MKWMILSICLLTCILFSTCSNKQVREEKYADGMPSEKFEVIETDDGSFIKDGYWKKWYSNGQISVIGNYENNLETGTWTYYYSTGNKQTEGSFQNGKKQREWKRYLENGQIKTKENYLNGELDGKQTYWSDDGLKYSETNFQKGKKNLEEIYYDKNGQIIIKYNFDFNKNTSLYGTWIDESNQYKYVFKNNGIYEAIDIDNLENPTFNNYVINDQFFEANSVKYRIAFLNESKFSFISLSYKDTFNLIREK